MNKKCLIIDWNEQGIILREESFFNEIGYVVEWDESEYWMPKDSVKLL